MLATALPSASTTEKWVVWVDSCAGAGGAAGGGGRNPAGRCERCRGRWAERLDGLAPGGGVGGREHLLHGHGGEVGVAEVVGAVHVGAAEGFGDEVDLLRRAVAHLAEVVAGEDVEDLQQHDAAGRWRRRGDDVVAAIAAGERLAVFDLVGGEVGGGDQSPALLHGRGEFGGHGAV